MIYVGEPLAKFRLFASVSGNDTTHTKEIKYKEELSGETPCKIPVIIFSCAALFGLPREAKSVKFDQVGVIRKHLKENL